MLDQMGRTWMLTALAMIAFAANSILCRLALAPQLIDAASFTSIRVLSGALLLSVIVGFSGSSNFRSPVGNWRPGLMLFTYMIFFSFAYHYLSAGTGALILFGAVQLTMIGTSMWRGERLNGSAWLGLLLATGGLVYLVSPGLMAPDPTGAMLMAVAGVAWGVYSLLGKGVCDPIAATASSFIFSVPLVLFISLLFFNEVHISSVGVGLALLSGMAASACGYMIWYAALPALRTSVAASVQLSVPVFAALGGAILLSEDITIRMLLSSVATLGGIAIVIRSKERRM